MKDHSKGFSRWFKRGTQNNEIPNMPEALPENTQNEEANLMELLQPSKKKSSRVFSVYEKSEDTCIGSDTVVKNSIESSHNVQIDGRCEGDVTTKKSVLVSGLVNGNINARNVHLFGGTVNGTVQAQEKITMDAKAIMIGNITACNLETDGKIKGNCHIENTISIKSSAIIHGNITAQNIDTMQGAVINGKLTMVSPKSDQEVFALPVVELQQETSEDPPSVLIQDEKGNTNSI